MRRTAWTLAILVFLSAAVAAEDQVYVFQRGDTVYGVARQYGVSADTLMDYNSIDDPTRVPVGARIRIPGETTTYTVQDGDYPLAIARRLGVDWVELLGANGLDRDDIIHPGDVLVVPGGVTVGVATTPVATVAESTGTGSGTTTANDAEATASPSVASATGQTIVWPHPGEREAWDERFRGVVMSGQAGDNFHSVTSGVVSWVGPFTSFGKVVFVRSENGYLYAYGGADRVDVEMGDHVSNGTLLGSVGVSPAFQSARVLFAVWRNNRYIDPESAPRG